MFLGKASRKKLLFFGILSKSTLPLYKNICKDLVLCVMTLLCRASMVWSPALSQPTCGVVLSWSSTASSSSRALWNHHHHHHLHCHHHHDHIVSGAHLVAAQVVHLTLHHRLPPNVHLSVVPRFNNSLRTGHIFNRTTIIIVTTIVKTTKDHSQWRSRWVHRTLVRCCPLSQPHPADMFFASKSHFDQERMFFVFYSNLHSGLYPWKPEERKRLRILI